MPRPLLGLHLTRIIYEKLLIYFKAQLPFGLKSFWLDYWVKMLEFGL